MLYLLVVVGGGTLNGNNNVLIQKKKKSCFNTKATWPHLAMKKTKKRIQKNFFKRKKNSRECLRDLHEMSHALKSPVTILS